MKQSEQFVTIQNHWQQINNRQFQTGTSVGIGDAEYGIGFATVVPWKKGIGLVYIPFA